MFLWLDSIKAESLASLPSETRRRVSYLPFLRTFKLKVGKTPFTGPALPSEAQSQP